MVLRMNPIDWFRRDFLHCCGSSSKNTFRLPSATSLAQWGDVHQSANVATGGARTQIFSFTAPSTGRAFITRLGNNMFASYTIEIVVDGQVMESGITREIGTVAEPQLFEPPIFFRNTFIVYAYNNGAVDALTGEFLIDGMVYDYGEFTDCIQNGAGDEGPVMDYSSHRQYESGMMNDERPRCG